jgi:hypothetical protein
MKIGCPKEIKPQEFRVGITPNAAREAVAHGHTVMIETNAGTGAGALLLNLIRCLIRLLDHSTALLLIC